MRKAIQSAFAVAVSVPAVALAHPGHGAAAPEPGLMHQLLEHGGAIALGALVVAGAVGLVLHRRSARSR